jgi:hypothetical protein
MSEVIKWCLEHWEEIDEHNKSILRAVGIEPNMKEE